MLSSAMNVKIRVERAQKANDRTSIVLQELMGVATSVNHSFLPSPYVCSLWAWWSRNMDSRGTESGTSFLSCYGRFSNILIHCLYKASTLYFIIPFLKHLFLSASGCYSSFLQLRNAWLHYFHHHCHWVCFPLLHWNILQIYFSR